MKDPYDHDNTLIENKLHSLMVETLNKYMGSWMNVLDIGAHSPILAGKIPYKTYTLVDTKFSYTKPLKNVIYNEMNHLDYLKHSKRKFHFIILSLFIEHIKNPFDYIHDLSKILHRDGMIYIRYPNAKSLNRILGVEMELLKDPYQLSYRDKEVGHINMFDINFLLHLGLMSDYKIEDYGGYMFKPLPNSMMDEYFSNSLDILEHIGRKLGAKYCAELWCLLRKLC